MRFRLHWPAFIIAFAVGCLFVYLFAPAPQVVYKFPNPYNAGKTVYKDAAGTCFSFRAERLDACPKTGVKPQPIAGAK